MHPWIADRTTSFDSSGIRKVFDLAAKLKDPINLSIGQPDFDVPEPIRAAAIEAIQTGKNAYTPTQGIRPLREAILTDVQKKYQHHDRDVFVSSGTSGGLMLAMLSIVNPGDEVIYLDPYFVMYPALVRLCGGIPVPVQLVSRLSARSRQDPRGDHTADQNDLGQQSGKSNGRRIQRSRTESGRAIGGGQKDRVGVGRNL